MVLFFIVNRSEILLEQEVAALLLLLDPQKSSDGSSGTSTSPNIFGDQESPDKVSVAVLVCPEELEEYQPSPVTGLSPNSVKRSKQAKLRNNVCQICGKSYATTSTLKKHMLIHTGKKPYKCEFCTKSFSDSSTLTKHKRIHTGEKPYHCKICKSAFSQSGNLHRHVKRHRCNNTDT